MGGAAARCCHDKPELESGLPDLDEFGIQKLLKVIATAQSRNYVVMGVSGNLLAEERQEAMKRFRQGGFKLSAHVQVGEPPAAFKASVQEKLLAEKQEKAEAEARRKKAEAERKKA